jgi:L-fuconolactonase
MAQVVDVSAHIFSGDRTRYPLAARLGGVLPAWARGRQALTAEELLGLMAEVGVHQAVLVHQPNVYDTDHSYLFDSARRYPESLVVQGAIEVYYRYAPQMASWLREQGAAMYRFEHDPQLDVADWIDSPRMTPVWEEAAKGPVPVSLPWVQMRHIPILRKVLERFPTVPMVLRRFAGAPMEDGPPYDAAKDFFALAAYPNVYHAFSRDSIRAAAKGKSTPQAFFDRLTGTFGANRLMWGSYYGTNVATGDMQYKDLINDSRAGLSFLRPDDLEFIFGGAAQQLIPGLRREVHAQEE